MMCKNKEINYDLFRAVLVGRALVSFVGKKINKNMVFTVSRSELPKDFEEKFHCKDLLVFILASLPFFTHGITTTILSLSTLGDPLWNESSLIASATVSGPIFCFAIDKCGRRLGIFLLILFQGTTCIPIFLPQSNISIIIVHILTGICYGGLFTIIPIYISEICPMMLKPLALSLMMVMTSAGYLMKLALNIEEMMLMMVALVMVEILALSVMVESPSYLVKAGKYEAAEIALARLKSLGTDHPRIPQDISQLKQESERAKANGTLSLLQIFKNKIWWDIIKIGVMVHTAKMLCGSVLFLDQNKILSQLELPPDPDEKLVTIGWTTGSLCCLLLIKFVDRKYLFPLGYGIMVLSMGVLGVYTQADLTVKTLRRVPIVMLPALVFGYGLIWGLPTIIMVEMLNFEIRATALGFLCAYSELLELAHLNSIQYIEDYIGTYTMFYIFACANLYFGVYTLFALPNIKNKSIKQIEKQMRRIPIV